MCPCEQLSIGQCAAGVSDETMEGDRWVALLDGFRFAARFDVEQAHSDVALDSAAAAED